MIHTPTLLGYSSALLASIAFLMLALRPSERRLAWFAAPFAAGAMGFLFHASPFGLTKEAGFILGTGFISLCFAFGWQALRTFFGMPARWLLLLGPPGAWVVASALLFEPFNLEVASALARMGLIALYSALAARLLLGPKGERLPSRFPLAMVFATAASVACIALPLVGWLPKPLGAAPAQAWAVAVLNAQIVLEVLLASALMVSMAKERAALEFYEASIRDPLTTLYNRRFLEQRKNAWQRTDLQEQRKRAFIYFDIDHFKRINDDYGHALGDEVIVLAAHIAQRSVRKRDWVFRIGGEEFLCVLPDCDRQEARATAERLRTNFQEAALVIGGQPIEATLSAGVAVGIAGQTHVDDLIKLADYHLYVAKLQGRNRVVG